MPRIKNPETGLVVSCGDDLAARYQSRGWVALDGATKPAVKAASEKPESKKSETADDEKPVRRGQTRRR